MKRHIRSYFSIIALALLVTTVGWSFSVSYHSLDTLQGKAVPLPDNLDDFVKDRDAAIQLGKALFWDMQLGADGVQTCGSCHFTGGADNRIKNQMRPAGKDESDIVFSFGGPNYTYRPGDFPFPKPANEVSGSQGTYHTKFLGTTPGASEDNTQLLPDPVFSINGINTRQVALRNAPTVVNAIFMSRGLWDGRANNQFNGNNPFGPRDPGARIWVGNGSSVWDEAVAFDDAAIASVATGPPTDNAEVSAVGRTWPFIGKRLLSVQALAGQQVHPSDSHLGTLRDPSGGINLTYQQLVERAFRSRYYGSLVVRSEELNGTWYDFTQSEENFSLYAGLSIMLYISTQVSDESPYDDYVNGDSYALNAQELEGLDLFLDKGKCVDCHSGPDFTNAGFVLKDGFADGTMVNTFRRQDGKVAVYDRGFFNIGVRANEEDHGLGRNDDFGNDLSFAEQFVGGPQLDPFAADPGTFDVPIPSYTPLKVAIEGAIKTPGLRNIELTGPYMRSGGFATLRQVVDFFDRGGDYAAESADFLHPSVQALYLSDSEKDALVAFMLTLTDERVRNHQAPFDHPQIFLPNGHEGDQTQVWDDGTGKAATEFIEIPAVGRNGYAYLPPELTLFNEQLGLSHFDGATYPPPPNTALCYVIADNDAEGQPSRDVLTALPSGAYGADVRIGETGTDHIEAAAFNPWTRELFAADAQTLGTVSLTTGTFYPIGDFGWGDGIDLYGNPRSREFLDVDGLAFDPVRSGYRPVLYGSVREVGEPDLLIQIDPATGAIVPNAFGAGQDYVTIRGVDYLTDIDDIAVSPWDGELYAVNNRNGENSRLVTLDRYTGVATEVLDLPLENVEGLAFFGDGTMYGTAGEGDEVIVVIDLYSNTASVQPKATLGAGGRDYEAIDCLTNSPNRVAVLAFGDSNGDGTMQVTESGSAGLSVRFFRDQNENGLLDGSDLFLDEVVTGSDGMATFQPAATGSFLMQVASHVESVSFSGFGELAGERYVGMAFATSTANESEGIVPSDFALMGTYPNPFNPQTTATFLVPEASNVRLSVFDLLGREVSVLVDGMMEAGTHEVTFQAGNLPSGTYLLRMAAPGAQFSRTMTLLK
jgi:cytochrome c peroxidase